MSSSKNTDVKTGKDEASSFGQGETFSGYREQRADTTSEEGEERTPSTSLERKSDGMRGSSGADAQPRGIDESISREELIEQVMHLKGLIKELSKNGGRERNTPARAAEAATGGIAEAVVLCGGCGEKIMPGERCAVCAVRTKVAKSKRRIYDSDDEEDHLDIRPRFDLKYAATDKFDGNNITEWLSEFRDRCFLAGINKPKEKCMLFRMNCSNTGRVRQIVQSLPGFREDDWDQLRKSARYYWSKTDQVALRLTEPYLRKMASDARGGFIEPRQYLERFGELYETMLIDGVLLDHQLTTILLSGLPTEIRRTVIEKFPDFDPRRPALVPECELVVRTARTVVESDQIVKEIDLLHGRDSEVARIVRHDNLLANEMKQPVLKSAPGVTETKATMPTGSEDLPFELIDKFESMHLSKISFEDAYAAMMVTSDPVIRAARDDIRLLVKATSYMKAMWGVPRQTAQQDRGRGQVAYSTPAGVAQSRSAAPTGESPLPRNECWGCGAVHTERISWWQCPAIQQLERDGLICLLERQDGRRGRIVRRGRADNPQEHVDLRYRGLGQNPPYLEQIQNQLKLAPVGPTLFRAGHPANPIGAAVEPAQRVQAMSMDWDDVVGPKELCQELDREGQDLFLLGQSIENRMVGGWMGTNEPVRDHDYVLDAVAIAEQREEQARKERLRKTGAGVRKPKLAREVAIKDGIKDRLRNATRFSEEVEVIPAEREHPGEETPDSRPLVPRANRSDDTQTIPRDTEMEEAPTDALNPKLRGSRSRLPPLGPTIRQYDNEHMEEAERKLFEICESTEVSVPFAVLRRTSRMLQGAYGGRVPRSVHHTSEQQNLIGETELDASVRLGSMAFNKDFLSEVHDMMQLGSRLSEDGNEADNESGEGAEIYPSHANIATNTTKAALRGLDVHSGTQRWGSGDSEVKISGLDTQRARITGISLDPRTMAMISQLDRVPASFDDSTTENVERFERKHNAQLYCARSPMVDVVLGKHDFEAEAMLDTGAEVNTIAFELATAAGLTIFSWDHPFFQGKVQHMTVADGSRVPMVGWTVGELAVRGTEFDETCRYRTVFLFVMPTHHWTHELILGMPWMRKANLTMEFLPNGQTICAARSMNGQTSWEWLGTHSNVAGMVPKNAFKRHLLKEAGQL
jgi:hypothetical protein